MSGLIDLIEITIQIRNQLDNNNMNTIKFTNYNALGQPQNVLLTTKQGVEVLSRWPHTKYYDKADKEYKSLRQFTNIKNNTYA